MVPMYGLWPRPVERPCGTRVCPLHGWPRVAPVLSCLGDSRVGRLLDGSGANAGTNVLTLPPPDDGGRGWLPSPGLPEPDSTPSFGHPIHTDDTTKRHTPDLQLFGAWSVDYMSTMARNIN